MRLPILLMSACIFTATASAQTTIRFSNDWKWEGPAAPLLMALDRGWYTEVGLDVTMDTGKGSREAIPRGRRRQQLADGRRRHQLAHQVPGPGIRTSRPSRS